MNVKIHESWKKQLQDEFSKPYFEQLSAFVKQRYLEAKVFPPPKSIFHAFDATPFEEVKVVVLGQDPYHGPGQANGLCFSVGEGVPLPPSLKNIFKEIRDDLGVPLPERGDLDHWARQGVLLLNATLTVEAHQPSSHQGRGWEEFTDTVVRTLADRREGLVFLLWGAYAQKKGEFIDTSKHLVLKAAHPSPFSVIGFSGCRHFSQTNKYLHEHGMEEIKWVE